MDPLHSLLKRQLKSHAASLDVPPKDWQAFLETVNRAYRQSDDDRRMLERSLDLSSQELLQANAHLDSTATRRFKHVQGMRLIDRAIASSLDLNVTLEVVLDQVIKQLGVDAADVLLLNRHLQTLGFAASAGFRTTALQHTTDLRLGKGHAGRAALERRLVSVPDLSRASGFLESPLLKDEQFVAYYAMPLITKGQVTGVLEIFHRRRLDPDAEWLHFLETLAGQAAIAIDDAAMFHDLQRANIDLTLAYETTLEGWSRALDLRDKATEGHSQRVAEMTLRLARAMGITDEHLVHIRRGALLHDIGKIAIPDAILFKPGPLTDEEWEIMRRHPVYAYELLAPIAHLQPALDIPYCHHERWDGTGYPRGLRGEQIPEAARIFAVVDDWDALNSDRPYRAAWSEERVSDYLHRQAGKHFDPKAVEVFLALGASTSGFLAPPHVPLKVEGNGSAGGDQASAGLGLEAVTRE